MRMTVPRRLRAVTLDEVELGVRICRSWVLLLGVIPFEYDDLVLVERGPGLRFVERSSTLMAQMWPGAAVLFQRVVRTIFAHRHRRLAATYQGRATPGTPT
jgi:hypothetical protein